ncbi:MAG: hypothetical protein WCV93_02165 [Candidatus Shapirobacteria bacterium]|jgi:hypothetical protein
MQKGVYLLLGLVLLGRLLVSTVVFHSDILCQAGWGNYIYSNGGTGFYENPVWIFSWPNHPPLMSLMYGAEKWLYWQLIWVIPRLANGLYTVFPLEIFRGFYVWGTNFEALVSPEIPFEQGYLFTMKLLSILADMLIGVLLYSIAKKKTKKPLAWPLVYWLSPFSWYVSSLWGQTDSLAYLFVLTSFLLIPKNFWGSLLSLWLAVSLKPTAVLVVPLFLVIWPMVGLKLKSFLMGAVLVTGLTLAYVIPFSAKQNPLQYSMETVVKKVFYRAEFRLTTNSYNFWHIFTLDKAYNQNQLFFGVSGKLWGLMLFAGCYFLAIKKLKKGISQEAIFSALFIVSAGGWLFLTNMLERYYYMGVVTGLIITIWNPKLFRPWLLMSLIFWLNLFRHWWYPGFLWPVRWALTAGNYWAGLPLSLVNAGLYVWFCWSLIKNDSLRVKSL